VWSRRSGATLAARIGFYPIRRGRKTGFPPRNVNTSAFEVYDIANNQLTGAAPLGSVGLDWQVGGFAAEPPAGSSAGSTSQLVQAMAGFGSGSGAAEGLNTGLVSADASQQTLLTTPQHV